MDMMESTFNKTSFDEEMAFDESYIKTDIIRLIIGMGLAAAIIGVFLPFLPILKERWLDCGTGWAVMLFSFLGLIMVVYENYFALFFINLFNLYFLFNETLVFYDKEAIRLGRVIETEEVSGYFRSAFEIFRDAFKLSTGAGLLFYGLLTAFLFGVLGWGLVIIQKNDAEASKAGKVKKIEKV